MTHSTKLIKTAYELLNEGSDLLAQRGQEYETNDSERSFNKIAQAFNTITGKSITPAEVALLMQILKDVRQWADPTRLHEDSVIDGLNYSALKGEELYRQFNK